MIDPREIPTLRTLSERLSRCLRFAYVAESDGLDMAALSEAKRYAEQLVEAIASVYARTRVQSANGTSTVFRGHKRGSSRSNTERLAS